MQKRIAKPTNKYEVDDILEQNGDQVLIKWQEKDLLPNENPTQWIALSDNAGLADFIEKNRHNPHSSTLEFRRMQKALSDNALALMPAEILALRQMIFDKLAKSRPTADGRIGRQRRLTISLPFSQSTFDLTFRKKEVAGLKAKDESLNTAFYINPDELTHVIGDGWARRGFADSTISYVNCQEKIHITWGYKKQIDYDHSDCPRCNYRGINQQECPRNCQYVTRNIPAYPFLSMTFTIGRRNKVMGNRVLALKTGQT